MDVGRALADYLQRARSVSESRRVFLRVREPHLPLTPVGITAIVIGAAAKAGLPPIGAHQLRHTAATGLPRTGAPLAEIGQLLRHRSSPSIVNVKKGYGSGPLLMTPIERCHL